MSTNDITRDFRTETFPMCDEFETVGFTQTEWVNGKLRETCQFGFNEHIKCGLCDMYTHRSTYVTTYPFYDADVRDDSLPISKTFAVCIACSISHNRKR